MTDESRVPEGRAEEFRRLVLSRTGLTPATLQCPREQSDMTPCIARDGGLAVASALGGDVCVGCERRVERLLSDEQSRHGVKS